MTGEQIYNEVKHIENKWGKGKRTNNNASENQEDTRGRGEKNVAESIVGTLLHVPGKTKDGLNARLDLAELGVKPELFAMQDEDKTTLPPAGYTLTNAEKDIFCETLHNIKEEVEESGGVSVEAIDLHISKEVATTRQAYYYGGFARDMCTVITIAVITYWPPENQRDMANNHEILLSKDCGGVVIQNPSEPVMLRIGSNPFLRPYPHTILLSTLVRALIEKTSLKIIDISSDSSNDRRWAAKKESAPVFYRPSTQGLLDAYGCDTIEEYLSWKLLPATDMKSTYMETTNKRKHNKDYIIDSNSGNV
ncbi:hypothetical protein Tco_0128358 [Tanacetum coccineum]